MGDSELDRAFARFRRQGDAAALGEVFDGVAPELLRLARHLVGDAGEAEDLVQATFVTAIERAGDFDEERRVVPWLVGILAKHAANARRARRARPTGAEVEAPDARPGPAQAAEERELREVLALELARLPETYRTIVTRFLLEGRSAQELARAEGLSDGAARVRVHRGLELLRRALPAGVATGVAVVGSGGRGLADVRARVLVAAREAGPALASVAGSGSVLGGLLGGVLVKKAVFVVLAALLVLALAWRGRAGRAEQAVASVAPPELAAAPSVVPSELARTERAQPAAREAVPAGPELVRALGLVVEYHSGAPVVGARVWSTPLGAPSRVERATVAADGRVAFELPRAELETLLVEADGFAPVAVPVTAERRARFWEEAGRNEDEPGVVQLFELRMQRGVAFSGRVVDGEGRGVAGAELGLLAENVGGLAVVDERTIGRSGPGGVIEADGLLPPARAGERWIVYALTADAFGFARLGLPAQATEHAPLEIRLLPARTLRLRVLGADETPLPGLRVLLVPNHEPFPYERGHSALPLPPLLERCLSATTGDDGVATFARMPAPERREPWELMGFFVEVWRGTELLLRGEEMFPEVLEGELARLRVPADGELAVFGHVRDASGRELAGVRVRLLEGERELASRVSGPDGGFRLPHGPEVERVLTITAEDERAGRAEDHFDRGARMERYKPVELVLRPRLPIEGVVRDEQGQPLAGCFVSARPLGGDAACGAEAPSDLRGHFRIPEAYEGEFELMLALPYEFVETLRPPELAPHVRGGDTAVEVVLAARAEDGCTLTIEARSAADAPLEVLAVTVLSVEEPSPGNEPRRRLVAGGACVTGLAPGRHDLWIATTGGLAHEELELVQPGEERALVVRVEPTGRLRVRIDLGHLPRPRSLLLQGAARSSSGRIPGGREYLSARVGQEVGEGLELELDGLLAGTWELWLYGEGLSPARVPVEVRAGQEQELVLVAAPGATLELELSAWSTYEAVELSIRDEFGAPGLLTTLDPRRPASPWTLAPGTLTWSVKPWRAAEPLVTGSLTLVPGGSARLVVPPPSN